MLPIFIYLRVLFSTLIFVHGVAAGYARPHAAEPTPAAASPCGVATASTSAALLKIPNAAPTIDAQLGYDYLTSVSLNSTAATELVQAILPYLEWQTDISYLKNPLSGYISLAVDIWVVFNDVLDNINPENRLTSMNFKRIFLNRLIWLEMAISNFLLIC